MNPDKDIPTPSSEDDFDELYIHTVSTEEFVEAVVRASQHETDDTPASYPDPS